jgi:hypothetical protein
MQVAPVIALRYAAYTVDVPRPWTPGTSLTEGRSEWVSSTQAGQVGRWTTRFRAAFTVVRDVSMTALALYGVWHQESSGKVNPWLLLTYVVILGIIPASHAVALARSAAGSLSSQPSSPPTPDPVTPSGQESAPAP